MACLLAVACDEQVRADTERSGSQDEQKIAAQGGKGDGAKQGGAGQAAGQKPEAAPKNYMRWVPVNKEEGRFETAVSRFVDDKGRIVEMIGAVHIGDTRYYTDLQKLFESYDALLYELVAPKDWKPQPGQKNSSFISQLQRFLKTALELDFQLDAVSYKPENFVHADLSPREFRKRQKERGESLGTMMLRAFLVGMKRGQDADKVEQQTAAGFGMLFGMFSKSRGRMMKLAFASQLEDIELMLSAWGGKDGSESTIIGDRNQACVEVLDEQLAKGKRKLGIFYGAAHMPDLAKRLEKRGFRHVKTRWVLAWDCTLSDAERAEIKRVRDAKAKRREEILRRRKERRERKAKEAAGGK